MANTKSAIKKIRQDKKRTIRNKALKNKVKYLIKRVEKLKKSAKPPLEEINETQRLAQKAIDKAAKRRVLPKNKASRLVSRLTSH